MTPSGSPLRRGRETVSPSASLGTSEAACGARPTELCRAVRAPPNGWNALAPVHQIVDGFGQFDQVIVALRVAGEGNQDVVALRARDHGRVMVPVFP